ncbi:hypothetical protein EKN06_08605 [Croceicoccus ponticola]|uniref:Argininosuccinate lyase n=1 Tax=Croceicoccus ponticola TaxID=2217664 RepID=A0A437GX71_9SPHN|nr:hypothetical protein [Croceicoccus ponticola]RVQ66995.1 hypothetical protein EKN06_08605 [Croceicoccus ponticola]
MRFARTIPFLAPALLLAMSACGDAPDAGSDSRNADGEVIEGSISDAMIPLDQLRSQGERLEPTDAAVEGEGAAANADGPPEAGEADVAGDGGADAAPVASSQAPQQAEPDEG